MTKILVFIMLFSLSAFSQTLLIKDVLENPKGKVVVIDSTITDTSGARKTVEAFFNHSNLVIVSLKDYITKKSEYQNLQTIFWGLLVKDGLIWNSLAGERADEIKKKYQSVPSTMSVIMFGKNPFTNAPVLFFTSKDEKELKFNRDVVDDKKSLNAFLKGMLFETGLLDTNYKPYELNSSLLSTIPDKSLNPDDVLKDGNITVYNYRLLDMTIVKVPDTLNFIFIPKDVKPFEEIAKENNFRYMINSTYFAGTNIDAKHCGRLRIYEQEIYPNFAYDKQIKYLVRYNRKNKTINYYYHENFTPSNDPDILEFQTGPIVIENNTLADTAIKSSINWARKTKRTLIASLDNKELFLITVRENTDMIDLGKFLLKLVIFKDRKLDVMNLDGGSSTALYSKTYPKLGYRLKSSLPLMIGIK